jgi:hypothetical protein
MVTGRLPFEHGINHNHLFDPKRNFEPWYWWADSLKVPTVFHLAQEKGLVTAATPWPVSVNGPFDYLIPEIEPVWDGNTVVTSFMCAPSAAILFRLGRSFVEKPFTSGWRKMSARRPSMEIRTTLGSEDFPFGRQLTRKKQ